MPVAKPNPAPQVAETSDFDDEELDQLNFKPLKQEAKKEHSLTEISKKIQNLSKSEARHNDFVSKLKQSAGAKRSSSSIDGTQQILESSVKQKL